MSIKTVPPPPYSPDLAPYYSWLFPKFIVCRYETIEEIKEDVTKVINTLTQEDFHGNFQKLFERYNRCIAAGRDYFEGGYSFICVLSIKVPIRKKSGNLFNDSRIYIYIYIYIIYMSHFAWNYADRYVQKVINEFYKCNLCYSYIYIYIYSITLLVVTISLHGFVADQMQYNLESAQYLW